MGASGRMDAGTATGAGAARVEAAAQDKLAREKIPRRTCLHKQLRKTKFCMYHLQGVCQYGSECAFAHSCVELQATPDLRKTRLCRTFMEGQGCTNAKCPFAHGEDELRSTDMFYKKTLCIWNEKGKCRNGDQCRFAHGLAELRASQGMTEPDPRQQRTPVAAGAAASSKGGAPAGQAGAGGGRRTKAQAGAATPAAAAADGPHDGRQNGPAEPMKILPTRSLLAAEAAGQLAHAHPPLAAAAAGGMPGHPHLAGVDGDLKAEIHRLQNVISALTFQCSTIKHNLYPQQQFGGHAGLEGLLAAAVSGGAEAPLEPMLQLAWQGQQLELAFAHGQWQRAGLDAQQL